MLLKISSILNVYIFVTHITLKSLSSNYLSWSKIDTALP